MARTRIAEPRTRLTGRTDDLDRLGRVEVWTAGLALPEELRLPSRRRRLWVTLVVLVLMAAIAVGGWKLANLNSSFDPSLGADDQTVVEIPGEDVGG